MSLDPHFSWAMAEELATAHMRRIGYPDAKRAKDGPDGGIDVASQHAVAQVKYWANPVGLGEIQRLRGIVHDGRQAIFYAFAGYTYQATAWAVGSNVALFAYTTANVVEPVNELAHALEGQDNANKRSAAQSTNATDRDSPEARVALHMKQIADVFVPFNAEVQDQVRNRINTREWVAADQTGLKHLDEAVAAFEQLNQTILQIQHTIKKSGWDATRFTDMLDAAFSTAAEAALLIGFDARRALVPLGQYQFFEENGFQKIRQLPSS